jgi:cytochrome c
MLLSACGSRSAPPDHESTRDEPAASVLQAGTQHGDDPRQPRFAAGDLERGELLGLACLACHTFGPGQEHRVGPNLHGMFGRPAATRAGFAYSDALRSSGITWTPEALDAWFANPSEFIIGTNMVFAGYGSASDRRDLIAYLRTATGQSRVEP